MYHEIPNDPFEGLKTVNVPVAAPPPVVQELKTAEPQPAPAPLPACVQELDVEKSVAESRERAHADRLALADVAGKLSEIPLTEAEKHRLRDLENKIERAMEMVIEFGQMLKEIRDAKLYRATYATFEEYLSDRWSASRRYGYRMIEIASVVEDVPTSAHSMRPSAIAELAPLRPGERRKVAKQAIENNWTVYEVRDQVAHVKWDREQREGAELEEARKQRAKPKPKQAAEPRPEYIELGAYVHYAREVPADVRISKIGKLWNDLAHPYSALGHLLPGIEENLKGLDDAEVAELQRAAKGILKQAEAIVRAIEKKS